MPAGEANDGELIGKTLGGRYRVTSTVGRGGMGVVARAVDELLGREVAVKILRAYTDASAPELADLRTRMQREAQAAARIRHGGVVTVHDVTEEEGLPVIVMELVDGPSLDDVLAERGPLEPREAAAIGAKLMDALDAAHRAGVLHRDVKPGNVLLERGGRVVLTDFGIATMDASGDEAMAKLTRSGEIIGSMDYLPPERAQGQEPGPASDIWSLGMTLYAAVEGTSPFRRTSVWSTLSAIVTEPLPEPQRAGPLAPVLRALMAKEPERRPTADRARAMLEQVAAGGVPGVAPPATAPAAVLPTPTASAVAPAASTAPSFTPPAPATPAPSFTPPAPAASGFGPPPAGGAGAVLYHQPSPQPPQPPHIGYAPPGRPPTRTEHSASPAGRRSRALIAAAAAGVVLAVGGVAYALTGEHGAGGGRAQASAPQGGSTAGSDRPSGPPQPSPSATSQGKPSASPSRKPGASASPTASTTANPSPVSTSCTGWNHRDPAPGSYGYMSGDYHLETGPYQTCPAVALAKTGTKLWYHCYIVNAHGNKWTYVRVEGTNTTGWMSNDNLTRQKGPSTPCSAP
ncbi:serine/threonine-protein kinase [Streptomyces sp. NPDC059989]|uniref:serine/threonine-protein kinase n=1 Tax=Streptomyces sp. NPDC059989 TaxID=3347026 RepID=UPI003680C5F9